MKLLKNRLNLQNSVNTLKVTELHTLNQQTVRHMNYISMKLFI